MEAGICEAVDEAESDCDSEDDPILMNSRYLVHGTTLYNLLPVCVSASFKQALIFQ